MPGNELTPKAPRCRLTGALSSCLNTALMFWMLSGRPEKDRGVGLVKHVQNEYLLRRLLCCRYIEQVAVALRGRERAVVTIQALLRSCKAKTVSSAAAMHQVCQASLAATL